MNHPDLYRRSNELQRSDAEQICKEFFKVIQWRWDGRDTLIDIGCGPGNVLMDILRPLLSSNFEKIIGVDISPKMIEHAREYYKNCKHCEFEILDIGTEKPLPSHLKQQFDHVMSFFCLHWVSNIRQAFKNIYNLIRREGGDCLLVLLVSFPFIDAYIELSKSPKWCSIMGDVLNTTSNLYHMKDPKTYVRNILNECGFTGIQMDVRSKCYTYKDINKIKDQIKNFPLHESKPLMQNAEFMDVLINVLKALPDFNLDKEKNEITLGYKYLVIYARRGTGKKMICKDDF